MVNRYRELIAKPNITLLEGIGHYPQCEDPLGTLTAFLDFINSLGENSFEI